MGGKPHLSASQLAMWSKCPYSWARRYVDGEIIPPGIAALTGTGVHAGAETNFRQKIDTHEDLPANDIVDAAVAGFEARKNGDGFVLTDDEATIGATKVLGTATDQVAQLAKLHATAQAPDYQPTAVEHTTRIVLPNATHDLMAVTDLRDDRGRVVDFKTAAKKPAKEMAANSLQLTVYTAAYAVDNAGRLPRSLRLDFLTKTKTPADTSRTRRATLATSVVWRVESTQRLPLCGPVPIRRVLPTPGGVLRSGAATPPLVPTTIPSESRSDPR